MDNCINADIQYNDIFNYTFSECRRIISAKNKLRKDKFEENLLLVWKSGYLNYCAIGAAMSEKNKFPTFDQFMGKSSGSEDEMKHRREVHELFTNHNPN